MKIDNFDTANITKQTTVALWTIALICIGLGIGGFITPPPGEIHDSVLKFCALLVVVCVVAVVREAIKEGRGIKVKHNDTTVEVNSINSKETDSPEYEEDVECDNN